MDHKGMKRSDQGRSGSGINPFGGILIGSFVARIPVCIYIHTYIHTLHYIALHYTTLHYIHTYEYIYVYTHSHIDIDREIQILRMCQFSSFMLKLLRKHELSNFTLLAGLDCMFSLC